MGGGPSEELKVTYVPTTDDYVEYIEHFTRVAWKSHSRSWMVPCFLPVIIGMAAAYELAQNPQAGSGAYTALTVALVCLVLFLMIVIAVVFDRGRVRRHAQQRFQSPKFSKYFFLSKTFEASRDGLRLSDEMSSATASWRGIESVTVTEKAIYVEGAAFTFVLPAHAFSNETGFVEGANRLQAWLDVENRQTGKAT